MNLNHVRFKEILEFVQATSNCIELAMAVANSNWHLEQIRQAIRGCQFQLRRVVEVKPAMDEIQMIPVYAARKRLNTLSNEAHRRQTLTK